MRHISLPCGGCDINHDRVMGMTFHTQVLGGTYFVLVRWVGLILRLCPGWDLFQARDVGGTYLALVVCVGLILHRGAGWDLFGA